MSTSAQINANQANAQHSTGPKSAAGKALAAQNHLRWGLTGTFHLLAWESREHFDVILDSLHAEHQPSTPTENMLIERMAQALWLTRRAIRLQDATFNPELPLCEDPKQLALLLRYQTTHERAFHKCLNEFLKLRAEKRKVEIGFESQQHKKAADTQLQELRKLRISLAEAKLERHTSQNSAPTQAEPRARRGTIPAEKAA